MRHDLLLSALLVSLSVALGWAEEEKKSKSESGPVQRIFTPSRIARQPVEAVAKVAPKKMIRLDVLIATVAFDERGKLVLARDEKIEKRDSAESAAIEAGTLAAAIATKLNEAKEPLPAGLSPATAAANLLLSDLRGTDAVESIVRVQMLLGDSGQPGYAQFGYRIPKVVATTQTSVGTTHSVELENVGTCVAATGRVTEEGKIVLDLDISHSELGREKDGTVIFESATTERRAPIPALLTLQTTLAAESRKAVVVSSQVRKCPTKVTETFVLVIPEVLNGGE